VVAQPPARAATARPGAQLDPALPYEDSKEAHDRAYFQALFDRTSGNVSEMARQADVTRTTIRAQLRRHGIERP
jgi:transcriptional regulator of acetoin/glycerol metabolism